VVHLTSYTMCKILGVPYRFLRYQRVCIFWQISDFHPQKVLERGMPHVRGGLVMYRHPVAMITFWRQRPWDQTVRKLLFRVGQNYRQSAFVSEPKYTRLNRHLAVYNPPSVVSIVFNALFRLTLSCSVAKCSLSSRKVVQNRVRTFAFWAPDFKEEDLQISYPISQITVTS